MSVLRPTERVHRARPLLGTLVSISIQGTARSEADRAIDAGFDAIAAIHRLMSFHESDSDVSRLNRGAPGRAVVVDRNTMQVIRHALDFSAASRGCFDVTVAGRLVEHGLLPRPISTQVPDRRASWRDIELVGEDRIRFHRPLWIDLGGIAKGYAVDHALAQMELAEDVQVCINAGGDLRVRGPIPEAIRLRIAPAEAMMPIVRLQDGSIASSSGREGSSMRGRRRVGPHVHGRSKATMGLRSFVSVVAQQCVVADALTKVVMARGSGSDRVLRDFGATAYICNARDEWRTVGVGA
ncbi:MAG TPA: FAD:protein FMN transferase [Steroidobacteraceae bacterium]